MSVQHKVQRQFQPQKILFFSVSVIMSRFVSSPARSHVAQAPLKQTFTVLNQISDHHIISICVLMCAQHIQTERMFTDNTTGAISFYL